MTSNAIELTRPTVQSYGEISLSPSTNLIFHLPKITLFATAACVTDNRTNEVGNEAICCVINPGRCGIACCWGDSRRIAATEDSTDRISVAERHEGGRPPRLHLCEHGFPYAGENCAVCCSRKKTRSNAGQVSKTCREKDFVDSFSL